MADELTTTGTNEEYKALSDRVGNLLQDKYQNFVADNTQNINTMYDAAKSSNLANLEMAYNQNLSDAEANRNRMVNQYNTAVSDLATQYERNRYNNNLQAASNGLNVGTGSQMALAQAGQYQRDYGKLRGEQAAQAAELDRQIADMTATYRSEVTKAIADGDYSRAAALVDEANNQVSQLKDAYSLQITDLGNAAELLAEAGDYTGYQDLYGYTDDQVKALQQNWAMSNPDAAYKSGIIDGYMYYQLTGNWPVGFDPWGGQNNNNSGLTEWDYSWYKSMTDYAKKHNISVNKAIDAYHNRNTTPSPNSNTPTPNTPTTG